ncbi:MAG: hypothetical protein ACJ8AH_17875 [Stellaceae bacterium]|jgi:hypothetical protein
MTRNVIVMTGLDPVIHGQCANAEEDGRNKSGHDDWGAGNLVQLPLIVVRS